MFYYLYFYNLLFIIIITNIKLKILFIINTIFIITNIILKIAKCNI